MIDTKASYRYFVTDLITNKVIGELPITGVSYGKALKDAGEFSGTIPVTAQTSVLNLYASTMPGRTGLYVVRNGVCVWGGILWTRSYDVVGKNLDITATEFTSYYHHRRIWKTWDLSHEGVLVYLDPKNDQQYIIELADGDDVTMPEDTAVELVFTDKKGFPFRGHYRVNKDFVNAKSVTVDKEALQWDYDGKAHYLPGKFKDYKIETRYIKSGGSAITLTTEIEHGLAIGDEVDISGLDANGKTGNTYDYDEEKIAVTWNTRSKTWDIKAIKNSNKVGPYTGTVSTSTDTDVIKGLTSAQVSKIDIGADVSQIYWKSDEGVLPTIGLETTVLSKPAGGTSVRVSRSATRNGDAKFNFQNTTSGYSHKYTRKGSDAPGAPQPYEFGSVDFTFTMDDDTDKDSKANTRWWDKGQVDDNTYIMITGVNAPGGGTDGFYTGRQKVTKISKKENGTITFNVPKVYALQFQGWSKPQSAGKIAIVDKTETPIPGAANRVALCANKAGKTPVIKVLDKYRFMIDPSCVDSPFTDTRAQDFAVARWESKYQATMHTHTDTYQQVRYLLGSVHSDFVYIDKVNPFLGNLEKYQIRTARYDTDTDLATMTTGFIRPVYSKAIEIDPTDKKIIARLSMSTPYSQFVNTLLVDSANGNENSNDIDEVVKVTGSDYSINGKFLIKSISLDKTSFTYNLPNREQDASKYTISSASTSGGNTTYNTSTSHTIQVGQIVSIFDSSNTSYNKQNVMVTSRTSTSFTVAVASTGTFIGVGYAYSSARLKKESYASDNESTITFGAHGLSSGTNITISGFTAQNYDGTYITTSIPNDVTFTYKPKFEKIPIDSVSVAKRAVDNKYVTTVYLGRTPRSNYEYLPNKTKITLAGLGSPHDGIGKLLSSISDVENDTMSPYMTFVSDTGTVMAKRPADYSERKYGTSYTVSAAGYVASSDAGGRLTGNGVATFTIGSHSFAVGDTVTVANVGGEFTQKVGSTNAYSELITTVTEVTPTQIKTNSGGLYKVNYKTDLNAGKINTSVSGVTGSSVRAYDIDGGRTPLIAPTATIDDLPDVLSPMKNSSKVLGNAYNASNKFCYLHLDSDPGYVKGMRVNVSGVDDGSEDIFDGIVTITKAGKTAAGEYYIRYTSTIATKKKDYGTFDKDTEAFKTFRKNAGGTVTIENYVYVGSYGSYTGASDIGIEFSTQYNSGNYQRAETYRGHEVKNVGEALAAYADKYVTKPGTTKTIRNIYGFDYRINCEYTPETQSFRRIFTFLPVQYPDAPVHGEVSPISRFGADKVVFEYPGNIDSVSLEESAEESSTRFWMVGSDGGTGTDNATKSYVGVASKGLLESGWPLLEADESNDKLDFNKEITEHAYRYLSETQPPTGQFSISVNGSIDPIVNSYEPGDWCSIIVNDQFVRDRLASDLEPRNDVIVRKILAYEVSVPDSPSFPESVSLTVVPEWDVDTKNG